MLTEQATEQIDKAIQILRSEGVLGGATVILMGSIARRKTTPRSDIDILIITAKPIRRWRVPLEVHLHSETRSRFLTRLQQGDDFPAWAIRLGEVVYDAGGWWKSIKQDLELLRIWPDWRLKIPQAEKRLRIGAEILKTGDADASAEQFLFATAHLSRALLLKSRVFPLSRPEMPSQLISEGEEELAEILKRLSKDDQTLVGLGRIQKKLSEKLDKLRE